MLSLLTSSLLAFAPPSSVDFALSAPASHVVLPQGKDRHDESEPGAIRPGKDRTDPVRGAGGPVPEPATMLLFGSGALGAAYVARRRRKAASEEIVEES